MHTSARISCGDEWGCVSFTTKFYAANATSSIPSQSFSMVVKRSLNGHAASSYPIDRAPFEDAIERAVRQADNPTQVEALEPDWRTEQVTSAA
jgi:hypothetical protein